MVCRSKEGKLAWLNPYLGTHEDALGVPCYSLHVVPGKKQLYVADGVPLVKDSGGNVTSQGSITRVDLVGNALTATQVATGLHAPRGVVLDQTALGERLLISISDGAGGKGRVVSFDLTTSVLKNDFYVPGSANNPGPGIPTRMPGSSDLYVPFANGFIDRIKVNSAIGTLVTRYSKDTRAANGSFNPAYTVALTPDTKTGGLVVSEYSSRSVLGVTVSDKAPDYGGDSSLHLRLPKGSEISPQQTTFGPCYDASAEGKPCDDGDACTTDDVCQAGSCVGTPPAPCTAVDACHEAGACQPATGLCSQPALPDGTACSTGTCQSGTCESGAGGQAGSGGQAGGGAAGGGGKAGAAGQAGAGQAGSAQAGKGGSAGSSAGKGGQAGASGASGGQGGKGGASGSAGSAPTQAADSGDDGGCGCRAAGGGAPGGWGAALLLGLAARRRRRRA